MKHIGDGDISLYRKSLNPYYVKGILIVNEQGFFVQEKDGQRYKAKEGDKVGIRDKHKTLRFYDVVN